MKKKLLILVLALTLLGIGVPAMAAVPQDGTMDTTYPANTVAYVAANPTYIVGGRVGKYVVDQIPAGWAVYLLGKETAGEFSYIQYYHNAVYNQFEGFTLSSNIVDEYSLPKTDPFVPCYGYTTTVCVKALNVHSGLYYSKANPMTIATIPYHQEVTVVSESTYYSLIQFVQNGKTMTGIVLRAALDPKVDTLKENLHMSSKIASNKKKITLQIHDLTASPQAKTYTWKTSNSKIATVSKSGVVKIKKSGTVTITCVVKCGNRSVNLKCKIKNGLTMKLY